MRHKWFPALVLALAAGWWIWHSTYARYHTLTHVIVLLVGAIAIGCWFLAFGTGSRRLRLSTVGVLTVAVIAFFTVFRPVYNGDMGVYRWRWRFAKSEDVFLKPNSTSAKIADWKPAPNDYPGFLGNGYWAEVKGVELETDWKSHPPEEVWRHEIGGGWSSFAIVGDYAFTQEQRGPDELVTCYRLQSGEPVWTHADKARFDPADTIGGLGDIGPRATPTIVDDRVFTQGGTGIVNCLDARTGTVIWSHDTAAEFGVPVTTWGKSGSPLVVKDAVVISVGGPSNQSPSTQFASSNNTKNNDADHEFSLVAFDRGTGKILWHAGSKQASYASPVLSKLAGEPQIVVINEGWMTSHHATDGKVLWEYPWSDANDHSASCAQPVPVGDDRLFLSKGYGVGCSLLTIKRGSNDDFSAAPIWTPAIKKVMKSKFSNVVLRDGYVYGLDDVLLECIELETGVVKWRKRREPVFGHGQIILIGDTILVLSETGELALVSATPTEYRELASIQALDDANVTWNNPAFASPYLLVRNAREVACYRLPLKESAPK